MTCEECRDHLSAFLDRELDTYHRREVETHLAGCASCAADAAALERTILALQDTPSPSESLLPTGAVLSRLPALEAGWDRAADRAAIAAAGAAVLGLGLALWLGLALTPGHLAFRLLTRITRLLYTLARGGMAPWIATPGLGWGLAGLAAGLLAVQRPWGSR